MKHKHITYDIPAAAATSVGLAQTVVGAAALLINGLLATDGIASFPMARHVAIAADADEHLVTFTVIGTDRFGNVLTEDLVGPTAGQIVQTTKNFKTVTGVSVDAALTGNVTLGTGDSLETPWIPIASDGMIDAGKSISEGGNATVVIQTTLGNVWAISEDELPIDRAEGFSIGLMSATAIRLKITKHVSGSVTFDILHRRQ